MIKVIENANGTWRVEQDGSVIADGLTNAEAWKVAEDRDRGRRPFRRFGPREEWT